MDREKIKTRLGGCYIAVPTLFRDSDLELNLDGMRRHVRFLLEGGVREGNAVLLVCGAAGDFPTLSVAERLSVAETVLDEVRGRVGVIVGAQSTSTREVQEMARQAARLGADAIQVSPPFYYSPTDDDVYEYMIAAADAADIALVLYTTWWMGYKMPLDLIGRLAEHPNVAGLKWGAPSADEYERGIKRFGKQLCVIDNQIHCVLGHLLGARGVNTHPSNYWPEWGVRLWELLEAGSYREAQDETTRVVGSYYDLAAEIARFTGGEALLDKLCVELVGHDSSRCRPPSRDIRPLFREKARAMLRQCGVPRCG